MQDLEKRWTRHNEARRALLARITTAGAGIAALGLGGSAAHAAAATPTHGNALWSGTATGTGNALILTPPAALKSYTPGQQLVFQAGHTSTGGALTVNVSGLGVKNISASRLVAGQIYQMVYDGTHFHVTNSSSTFDVRLFGAVGNGVTDDTKAIQAALSAATDSIQTGQGVALGNIVDLPSGVYFVSATLKMSLNTWLRGEGVNATQIVRTGDYGDTVEVGGKGNKYPASGAARVSGIWFQQGQMYDNKATSLDHLATKGAHLHIHASQWTIIENCWINRMPYNIHFDGGSWQRVLNCLLSGQWDDKNPALQETIANVFFDVSPDYGNPTSAVLSRNEFLGGIVTRDVSFTATDGGKKIEKFVQCIGAKSHVLVHGLEDGTFSDNYFGGASGASLDFFNQPKGATIDIRILGNMFDGNDRSAIEFRPVAPDMYTLNATVAGNTFNGSMGGRHAIYARANPTTKAPSVYNLAITGNTYNAYYGTPIMLEGASGFTCSGNTLLSYNCFGISKTDPSYINGIWVSGHCGPGSINGNVLGGGGNVFIADYLFNFCYGGIAIDPSITSVSVTNNTYAGIGNPGSSNHFTLGRAESENQHILTTGDYQMTVADEYVICQKQPAAATVKLPLYPPLGRKAVIVGGKGSIVVSTGDGTSIDDAASDKFDAANTYRTYRFNGSEWNRVG